MTPLIPITAGLRIAARLGNYDTVLPVTQRAAALANTPRPGPCGCACVEMFCVEDVTWTDQGPEYAGYRVWVAWESREGER